MIEFEIEVTDEDVLAAVNALRSVEDGITVESISVTAEQGAVENILKSHIGRLAEEAQSGEESDPNEIEGKESRSDPETAESGEESRDSHLTDSLAPQGEAEENRDRRVDDPENHIHAQWQSEHRETRWCAGCEEYVEWEFWHRHEDHDENDAELTNTEEESGPAEKAEDEVISPSGKTDDEVIDEVLEEVGLGPEEVEEPEREEEEEAVDEIGRGHDNEREFTERAEHGERKEQVIEFLEDAEGWVTGHDFVEYVGGIDTAEGLNEVRVASRALMNAVEGEWIEPLYTFKTSEDGTIRRKFATSGVSPSLTEDRDKPDEVNSIERGSTGHQMLAAFVQITENDNDPVKLNDLEDATGRSYSTVHRHVQRLQSMGLIEPQNPEEIKNNKAGKFELTNEGGDTINSLGPYQLN